MSSSVTYVICENCQGLNRVAFDYAKEQAPICGKCKKSLSLQDGVSHVTDKTLDILIQKSPLPVIVDFWAPWCGPCLSFAPTFTKAAQHFKNQVVFAKIDTQSESKAGGKFSVRGIPTLVFFKKGHEVDRISGALPFDQFVSWLQQTMGQ